MAKYKVTAPAVPAYQGMVGSVQFRDGVAEMDEELHAAELSYCRTAGYRVEDADEAKKAEQDADGGERAPDTPASPAVVPPGQIKPETHASPVERGSAPPPTPGPGEQFNPGDHNVEAVLAHLDDADRAEAERVLDAEAADKNRKGIVDKRDEILDSKKEGQS